MNRFLMIIACLLTFLSSVEGQVRKIWLHGTIIDSFTEVGIPDVKVRLFNEDSTLVDSMSVMYIKFDLEATYSTALFSFKVPATPKNYILRFEHPDYERTLKNVGCKIFNKGV